MESPHNIVLPYCYMAASNPTIEENCHILDCFLDLISPLKKCISHFCQSWNSNRAATGELRKDQERTKFSKKRSTFSTMSKMKVGLEYK